MKKHDFYKIAAGARCLYAILPGSWDDFIAADFSKDFLKQAKYFKGQPFCHLVYFDGFSFGIPEIEPIIQKLVDKLILLEMRYVAQVIPAQTYNMTQFQLSKMTQTKNLFEKQAFLSIPEASAWLKEKYSELSEDCDVEFSHEILNRYKNE